MLSWVVRPSTHYDLPSGAVKVSIICLGVRLDGMNMTQKQKGLRYLVSQRLPTPVSKPSFQKKISWDAGLGSRRLTVNPVQRQVQPLESSEGAQFLGDGAFMSGERRGKRRSRRNILDKTFDYDRCQEYTSRHCLYLKQYYFT